jgi:hypothetical protein
MECFMVLQAFSLYQKGNTAADIHGILYREHDENGSPA